MKCHLLHLSIVTRAGSLVVSECWGSPQSTPLFIIFTFLLALFFYLLSPPYMHPFFLFSLLYFPFSLCMKGIEWKKGVISLSLSLPFSFITLGSRNHHSERTLFHHLLNCSSFLLPFLSLSHLLLLSKALTLSFHVLLSLSLSVLLCSSCSQTHRASTAPSLLQTYFLSSYECYSPR